MMRIETAVIEVVNYCNLKCAHCYGVFEKRKTISLEDFQTYVKQLYELGVTRLTISGGEPMLLGNALIPYLEVARAEKMRHVTIVSNGTIDSVDYSRILTLADRFQISIDGDKDVHDKIRGCGNYDKSLKTLFQLVKLDPSKVNIMMALHSGNFTSLQHVYQLAFDNHVKFAIEVVTPCGRGSSIVVLSNAQLDILKKFLGDYNISCNDPLCFCDSNFKEFFNQNLLSGCAAGVSAICIGSDGTIFPCARLRLPLGNIKDGINVIFESHIYKDLNNRILFKGRCAHCSNLFVCGGCRARAYAEHNDYLAEDSHCITFEEL